MLSFFDFLFFAVSAAEVFAEAGNDEHLRFFSKPLLMIVLIILYARSAVRPLNCVHHLMLTAFLFSWIGDVALMFVSNTPGEGSLMGIPRNPNFFLMGLGAFLITHVLYTLAFAIVNDKTVAPLLPRKIKVIIPLMVYMVVLLTVLVQSIYSNPATRPFLAPVIVYSVAIGAMVLFAINRFGRVSERSFGLVLAGALAFMLSDSFIAINKFFRPVPFAGVWIMLLYCLGQYFIAKGSLAQFTGEK